jgi:hypothetical protein
VVESIENIGLSKGFASHQYIGHTWLRGVEMLKWISHVLVVKTGSQVGRSWKLPSAEKISFNSVEGVTRRHTFTVSECVRPSSDYELELS